MNGKAESKQIWSICNVSFFRWSLLMLRISAMRRQNCRKAKGQFEQKKIWMLLLLNSKPCALSGLTKQRTIYKIMKDIDCIWGQIACDSKLSIIKKIWSSFNKLKNPPSFHHFNPKLCWLFLQQWDVPVPYICRNPPWVPCKHIIIIYVCNI